MFKAGEKLLCVKMDSAYEEPCRVGAVYSVSTRKPADGRWLFVDERRLPYEKKCFVPACGLAKVLYGSEGKDDV